jgi:hypothetical protein
MELIKAIKSCKEVFVEVQMPSTYIWVKASKKDLLTHMQANRDFNAKELYIVTRYGNLSLYLAPEKA